MLCLSTRCCDRPKVSNASDQKPTSLSSFTSFLRFRFRKERRERGCARAREGRRSSVPNARIARKLASDGAALAFGSPRTRKDEGLGAGEGGPQGGLVCDVAKLEAQNGSIH